MLYVVVPSERDECSSRSILYTGSIYIYIDIVVAAVRVVVIVLIVVCTDAFGLFCGLSMTRTSRH